VEIAAVWAGRISEVIAAAVPFPVRATGLQQIARVSVAIKAWDDPSSWATVAMAAIVASVALAAAAVGVVAADLEAVAVVAAGGAVAVVDADRERS
jgi:hypothetical protein